MRRHAGREGTGGIHLRRVGTRGHARRGHAGREAATHPWGRRSTHPRHHAGRLHPHAWGWAPHHVRGVTHRGHTGGHAHPRRHPGGHPHPRRGTSHRHKATATHRGHTRGATTTNGGHLRPRGPTETANLTLKTLGRSHGDDRDTPTGRFSDPRPAGSSTSASANIIRGRRGNHRKRHNRVPAKNNKA